MPVQLKQSADSIFLLKGTIECTSLHGLPSHSWTVFSLASVALYRAATQREGEGVRAHQRCPEWAKGYSSRVGHVGALFTVYLLFTSEYAVAACTQSLPLNYGTPTERIGSPASRLPLHPLLLRSILVFGVRPFVRRTHLRTDS